MPERILSISGLRGIVGDGLDPEYVTHFAAALGIMFNGGTVVLSRDGRGSGEMLRHAVLAGLLGTGCRVIDLGIASTPTCGVLVQALGAAGGLQLTASHNPIEWNGLKPFSLQGSVFDAALGQKLLAALEQPAAYRTWDGLGRLETASDPAKVHLEKIRPLVNRAAIRERKFRVVLDCNHGSGSVLGPRLLEALGCDVEVLGGTPDGRFDHPAEPLRENLGSLMAAVQEHRADVGFAQDPDADRLAIVDNTGRYIGEELTLALCVDHVLSKTSRSEVSRSLPSDRDTGAAGHPVSRSPGSDRDTRNRDTGVIVVNGSTSRTTADLAAKYGVPFYRSHVGEANVVAKMREVNALLGGEGNGGVIEPRVGYVRDSFVGMAYVLEGLAARCIPLSEWVDQLPRYTIVKDKLHCPRERVDAACAALAAAFSEATPTAGDGLRLDWPDRWVQVRASNTEPIIRVIAEAPTEPDAKALCARAIGLARNAADACG